MKRIPAELCETGVPEVIDVEDNPLVCDCNLRWLMMLQLSGTELTIDERPCIGPAALTGRTWSSLTLEDLTCSGKLYSRHIS